MHANGLAQALMSGGPRRADRAAGARGADHARDQAARRPADRPPAAAGLAGRDRRRVRPHGRTSSRSRTSSRRSWARSSTRPTRCCRRCASSSTATGSCAATYRSTTSPTTASSCRSTPTRYTTIGGYVFDELGRLPKRGDEIRANGYLIRVESVRENRVEAVRIHPTAADRPEPPRGRWSGVRSPSASIRSAPSAPRPYRGPPYVVRTLHREPARDAEGPDPHPGRGRVRTSRARWRHWSSPAGTTCPRPSCPGPR